MPSHDSFIKLIKLPVIFLPIYHILKPEYESIPVFTIKYKSVKKYYYDEPHNTFKQERFVLPYYDSSAVAYVHLHPHEGIYTIFSYMDKFWAEFTNKPYYLVTDKAWSVYEPQNGGNLLKSVMEMLSNLLRDIIQ